jgi:hypothetical protein
MRGAKQSESAGELAISLHILETLLTKLLKVGCQRNLGSLGAEKKINLLGKIKN